MSYYRNNFTLQGNITQDSIKIHPAAPGKEYPIVSFSIYEKAGVKSDGEGRFHYVTIMGKAAERAARQLKEKQSLLLLDAKLEYWNREVKEPNSEKVIATVPQAQIIAFDFNVVEHDETEKDDYPF